MSDTKSPPTSSQVTDEDLIDAVREQCEKFGVPVVPTKKVAEAEGIDVTSQTVKRRLDDVNSVNSMQVGRGHIWWIPEDRAEARGEVDMSSVYLEELESTDIPQELIEEHPDGPPTYWESMSQRGGNGMWISLISVIAGSLIILAYQLSLITVGNSDVIGGLLILGGFFIFLVSLVIFITGTVLEYIGVQQPQIVLRRFIEPLRNRLADRISTD